jgi:citrate lyase subunit gamma (acyl carrier protein)
MEIKMPAQAGTLESNDVYVQLLPNPNHSIDIRLKSVVYQQFKDQILAVAHATLNHLSITSCILILDDQGALDYTIAARIESAVKRSLC